MSERWQKSTDTNLGAILFDVFSMYIWIIYIYIIPEVYIHIHLLIYLLICVYVHTKCMHILMMLWFRCLKILICKLPNEFMLQLRLFMDETEINWAKFPSSKSVVLSALASSQPGFFETHHSFVQPERLTSRIAKAIYSLIWHTDIRLAGFHTGLTSFSTTFSCAMPWDRQCLSSGVR